jgi:hypothetical protein
MQEIIVKIPAELKLDRASVMLGPVDKIKPNPFCLKVGKSVILW